MTYLGPGWTLEDHLAGLDPDLLALARTEDGRRWALTPQAAEARRLLTYDDPLLFAWIYTPNALRGPETDDQITFSLFHLECFRQAREWLTPCTGPAEWRRAYVAPRGAGKSTLWFKEIPLWAGAHLITDFIAAFADSGSQAEGHLQSFKMELDRNRLLRYDYPLLCRAAKRPGGVQLQDNRSMLVAESGFVFAAKGIDASSLGMKVGDRRPQVILGDDIEPMEGSGYSLHQKEKRLGALLEGVFPLNIYARVVLVGTTTMLDSVMHDVARQATEPDECPAWVADAGIVTHYFPAVVTLDNGDEVSLWPEKWSLDYLRSIEHTADYAKNYLNQPVGTDGGYFTPDLFGQPRPAGVTRKILEVDPAVTTKTRSDFTGLAVIGYSPGEGRCSVELARAVKLQPRELRQLILDILAADPAIRFVRAEVNQGGDWIGEVLNPLPVKFLTVHQDEDKTIRAARAVNYYQMGWVGHVGRHRAFEQQAVSFPKAPNDDIVDAVSDGLDFFLRARTKPAPPRPRSASYL